MDNLKKLYEEVKNLSNENREDGRTDYIQYGRTFRSKPEVELSEDYLSFGFYEEPIGENDWHYQVIIIWDGHRKLHIHMENLVSGKMKNWNIKLDEFRDEPPEWYDAVKNIIKETCLFNTNICTLYTLATNCELYPEFSMGVGAYEVMVNFLKP